MIDNSALAGLIKSCARCGACGAIETSAGGCPSGEFFGFEPYYPWGRLLVCKALMDGDSDFAGKSAIEKLFACNLCYNCDTRCGSSHAGSMVEVFEALRAEAFKKGGIPPAHQKTLKNLAETENIYGAAKAQRKNWLKNIKVKKAPAEKARVIYFAGCASALEQSTKPLARATVRLLAGAGADLAVPGDSEICCGSPALRLGDTETFLRLAGKNIQTLNDSGADTIVTSCAECLKTLRHDYPGGLRPEVLHTAEFLDRLLWRDEMSFTREVNLTAVYQDPCFLGRGAGIYEGPRRVLRRIPGLVLREMDRLKESAFCCGAGGGVSSAFPDMAMATARARLQEAEATGVTHLITACPFCFQVFSKAIKKTGSSLKLMDLVQIAGQAV